MSDICQNSVTYHELEALIPVAIADRVPLLIIGDPGIGKTSIPRQFAHSQGQTFGLAETLAYLFEPVDFRGLLTTNETNRTTDSYSLGKWPLQRLIDKGVYPKRGILLLDELLNAHRDVLTACAEPLCDHRVNGEPLGEGWSIVATGNHIGSGTSANPLPSHVANRVSVVRVKPTWDEWLVWATGKIRPELLGYFSIQSGNDLFDFDPKKLTPNQPYLTPRSLENLSRRLDAWYGAYPTKTPPIHVYSSVVGEYGGKLYATLDYVNELVPWPEIQADPCACRMPTKHAAVYSQIQVIAGALKSCGKIIPKAVAKAAFTYIQRFNQETSVVAMQQWAKATRGQGGVQSSWTATPEWAAWVKANSHLFTA
jgi:hypothetical protein